MPRERRGSQYEGFGNVVVEETNLVIPAGTDWQSEDHVVGEIGAIPPYCVIAQLSIELVAASPVGLQLVFACPNLAGSAANLLLDQELAYAFTQGILPGDSSGSTPFGEDVLGTYPGDTMRFVLTTPLGPTPEEITVSRVRASVLIF